MNFDFEYTTEIFQDILTRSAHGVIFLDRSKTIGFANHWMQTASRLKAEDMVSRKIYEVFPQAWKQALFKSAIESALSTANADRRSESLDGIVLPLYRPNEKTLMVQGIHVLPLKDKRNRSACMIEVFDLTTLVQAQLVHTSNMIALGEMAAGVAHEVNTPLGIIASRTGHIKFCMEKDPPDLRRSLEFLDVIEKATTMIATIVQALRTFSRSGDNDPFALCSIKQILADTLALCQEGLKHRGIELNVEEKQQETNLNCRPGQIAQVLLNLISNAADAVQDSKKPWVRVVVTEEDQKISFAVLDSGSGVQDEVAEKIFQPFFTTKDIGRGTGLGLSVARGIAEDHGGSLTLDRSGPNTKFVLTLPTDPTRGN